MTKKKYLDSWGIRIKDKLHQIGILKNKNLKNPIKSNFKNLLWFFELICKWHLFYEIYLFFVGNWTKYLFLSVKCRDVVYKNSILRSRLKLKQTRILYCDHLRIYANTQLRVTRNQKSELQSSVILRAWIVRKVHGESKFLFVFLSVCFSVCQCHNFSIFVMYSSLSL